MDDHCTYLACSRTYAETSAGVLAHNDLQIMSTNIETFERTVATQQPLSVEQNSKEVWHMGRSAKVVTKIEQSLGRLGHMRRRRRGIYVDRHDY